MANFKEKYGTVSKASNTQVQLADSVLKIGGRYQRTGSLTLNTGTSGFGGIDTGSVAASTFYYLYVVSNGSILGLVASTSATSPTGFTSYKKVGAFYTDSSSNIFRVYSFGETNKITLTAVMSLSGSTISVDQDDFINGNAVLSDTSLYALTWNSGFFSIIPSVMAQASFATTGVGTQIEVPASTSVVSIRTRLGSTKTASGYWLSVSKTGVDAIQPDWRDY